MENDLSIIIDRTALIENLLNQIICNYTSPREGLMDFFWGVILDSSVMNLGAKIKVVTVISKKMNCDINQNTLHDLIRIRNAFAHHALMSHPVYVVAKDTKNDEICYELQIIKSNGVIERKNRKDALEEFNKDYLIAKEDLEKLCDLTKQI